MNFSQSKEGSEFRVLRAEGELTLYHLHSQHWPKVICFSINPHFQYSGCLWQEMLYSYKV